MAIMKVRDFELLSDFAAIRWGPSIKYNCLRAVCASCVVFVLMQVVYISGSPAGLARGMTADVPFRYLIGDPFCYFLFLVFLVYPAILIRKLFPSFGDFLLLAVMLPCFFLVSIGDPLLYAIYLVRPAMIPTTPPLLSPVPFIVLLDEDVLPGTKVYS